VNPATVVAQELRWQFAGLKALIDGQHWGPAGLKAPCGHSDAGGVRQKMCGVGQFCFEKRH
jgi:hypothetical protein